MTRVGTKKIYILIKPDLDRLDIKCGRDKLHGILRSEGMLIKKKRNYMRTTNSYHRFYKYPNLIKDIHINRAEQVWVSDITYIRTYQGWLYLSLITDAYSKQIVGHQLSDNLKTINCINALKAAIKNRKYPDRALIHHSDRGLQYCNPDYVEILDNNNIGISMTTKHDPYENAIAERVNGILKDEFFLDQFFQKTQYAKQACENAIKLYNYKRLHLSLNYKTPDMVHQSVA